MFFPEFYRNKRIFITGHTGFKGSWLLAALHQAGASVKGYALPPSSEHLLFPAIHGASLCENVFHDILDYPVLEKHIIDFQPDIIFHLAAQPLVRLSYEQPVETFAVNAIGTANLLNAVRKLSVPCVVICITTDKVYHNYEWSHPYRESDRLGGHDPYSASKACAELVIDSFRNSFFNSNSSNIHHKTILSARAGNVIGGGDWAKDRIIPDIVRALQSNQTVAVRNPDAVRPWQHVLESVYAYLLLGSRFGTGEQLKPKSTEFNFGPEISDCLTVRTVVERAIASWGEGAFETARSATQVHEATLLKLDISRAAAELDWRPVLNASEAIERTIAWYRQLQNGNGLDLVNQDIQFFSDKLSQRQHR